MAEEYKALTLINLPFVGTTFEPGEMIPRERFEANADSDDASVSADDEIAALIEAGSLSEDPDAPLHPDHLPVDVGTGSINSVVQEARNIVEQLESEGREIPEELAAFAKMDVRGVLANDTATTDEKGA